MDIRILSVVQVVIKKNVPDSYVLLHFIGAQETSYNARDNPSLLVNDKGLEIRHFALLAWLRPNVISVTVRTSIPDRTVTECETRISANGEASRIVGVVVHRWWIEGKLTTSVNDTYGA